VLDVDQGIVGLPEAQIRLSILACSAAVSRFCDPWIYLGVIVRFGYVACGVALLGDY